MTSHCSVCGRQAEGDAADGDSAGLPLGWMLERDGSRMSAVCPSCTRAHLRAIEAKLEQQWW